MNNPRLINRNAYLDRGRTSIRLEPELWDALAYVADAMGYTVKELLSEIDRGGRRHFTSRVRVCIVSFLRGKIAGMELAVRLDEPEPHADPAPHLDQPV